MVSVAPDAMLSQVARMVAQNGSDDVVITRDGRPLGILTERDLLQGLAANFESPHIPVGTLAKHDMVCVDAGMGLMCAYLTMVEKGVRHLLVLDENGESAGLLTDADCLRLLQAGSGEETHGKLHLSEDLLRGFIDASSDFICFKDGEGRWLAANRSSLDLFHLDPENYVLKTDDELAELVIKYPDRFFGAVACLPMNDVDAALEEAERAITPRTG